MNNLVYLIVGLAVALLIGAVILKSKKKTGLPAKTSSSPAESAKSEEEQM